MAVCQGLCIKTRSFIIGSTIADLKASGKMPIASEELIATAIDGQIESMMVHRRGTGAGLAGEELCLQGIVDKHRALLSARLSFALCREAPILDLTLLPIPHVRALIGQRQ